MEQISSDYMHLVFNFAEMTSCLAVCLHLRVFSILFTKNFELWHFYLAFYDRGFAFFMF